jgi:PAS domain S-box-containing protein
MMQEKTQIPVAGDDNAGGGQDVFQLEDIAPFWLSALIDSADDAIVSKTLDGIIASWNKGAERIFGYTAEEVVGKPILILIPPEYRHEEPHILSRIGAGERIEHYETVRMKKDGTRLQISLTVSPIKNSDGKIIGVSKIARDITAFKEAEERLRKSENQLRLITDAVPALISYVDSEQRYTFVNRGYTEWFGLTPEEIDGKHIREVVGERAYASVLPKLERVFAGEQIEFEQLMPYPGGERIIHVNYVPDTDAATGKTKGFFALVRDISENKKAEVRLRESEARFAKAFDSSPLALTISSLTTGKLLEVNETFVETTGFSREEAVGKTTVELGLWADLDERTEEMETVREIGSVRNAEYLFHTRRGDIYGLLSAEQIEIGGESFALTVIQDITARKKAEQRLFESEERMRLATEAADIYSWEVDLEKQTIVYAENTSRVLGFSMPESLAESVAVIHPEDREQMVARFRQAVADRTNYEMEFRLVHPQTGEHIWQSTQGIFLCDARQKAVRVVGITQDITRRKRAEQEREELLRRERIARQQAEEASRLKDEFLATISHEIRTPLNAILGWSQMLISNKIDPKNVPAAVETIYRNAKSQVQLIEDILDVSRIITGKIRLEAQPISATPVIQTAVESLRPAIEAKNIRLQMRLDFEPRPIVADPNRLQQVVWNLLSNAIKFTPENGSVEIRLETGAKQTKIIVSDTGKGIDAEFLPFVFERFRQADGSSTRKYGGLGLGLAIVRHIVELHGGRIEVASEGEDKGATFTVFLPQAEPGARNLKKSADENSVPAPFFGEARAKASDDKIKGMRVLLVDDEIDTLELLGIVLKQSGALVRAETSVAAALEVIKRWKPDVIVSDIAMPREDGYSFIRKLRARAPSDGGAIPAIALTAYVGIKEQTRVLSSGFQMYVPKPVEPSELVVALASLAAPSPDRQP